MGGVYHLCGLLSDDIYVRSLQLVPAARGVNVNVPRSLKGTGSSGLQCGTRY